MKQESLRRAFFRITGLCLAAGLLLAALSFFLCVRLQARAPGSPAVQLALGENGALLAAPQAASGEAEGQAALWAVLQVVLPVFWVVAALLAADFLFYHHRLKRPLAALQEGAARIRRQDLDFSIQPQTADELGQLCAAFEAMRQALQSSNRELWRQMEERKRLNAAFAHDLRNPVTVLKGAAKMLQKDLTQDPLPRRDLQESAALAAEAAARLESYVERMTSAQKLEELSCRPQPCAAAPLYTELTHSLQLLAAPTGKRLEAALSGDAAEGMLDRHFFFECAENLAGNALRYAHSTVRVEVTMAEGETRLCVTDDGPGFPAALLRQGPAPFWRGEAAGKEHFGMGLFLCRLLCEKHGGCLTLENTAAGARATARFSGQTPPPSNFLSDP